MWSCSKGIVWLLACLLLTCSACTRSRRCGGVEFCNNLDDDCDGKIDETFVDELGRYDTASHCGRCGVDCAEVFKSAARTECDVSQAEPICRLASCPLGSHAVNETTCVRDQTVLCLPCETDEECTTRLPGALCVERASERRCGVPCNATSACPAPFECDEASGQCVPERALCACENVEATVEVACLAEGRAPDLLCAGIATCGPDGLSACKIAAVENCDGQDNDCDGEIDEDFRDERGLYVGRLHCGACGSPCSPPGEHYEATCVVDDTATSTHCVVACEQNFVDVDGIAGNGCECERFDGSTAPASSGGDNDCDGQPDDDSTFVHVTTSGNDRAEGALLSPLRTIQAAIERAQRENKVVLVAQGTYGPFALASGVAVFGGYRTDFRARDPALYPVVIEHFDARDGEPVLTCDGVQSATVVAGLTLVGQDASRAGGGSTAMRFSNCSSAVLLREVVVLAGRGADGLNGDDGAARLPSWAGSLADLDGRDGSSGSDATAALRCSARSGGAAALKLCGGEDVTGGAGGTAACFDSGCVNGVRPCANAGCSDFTNAAGICDIRSVLLRAVANPNAEAGRGAQPGSAGTPTYNSPTTRSSCNFCDDNPTLPRLGEDGAPGRIGTSGAAGVGCADAALNIDGLGRVSARAGSDGSAGQHGSGGGGGSAGSGFDVIAGTPSNGVACVDVAGGSGGSGGSGGCGAPGGAGGRGGGASVAILVQPTADGQGPTFERVRVVTASGGRGGDGGLGAAGGRSGLGAPGGISRFWCARSGGRGGDGGEGGSGGGGGGGCGGGSHAMLFTSPVSASYRSQLEAALEIELAGVAGQGGRGGFSPEKSGTPGLAGSDLVLR